jgi:hypothetical protein
MTSVGVMPRLCLIAGALPEMDGPPLLLALTIARWSLGTPSEARAADWLIISFSTATAASDLRPPTTP